MLLVVLETEVLEIPVSKKLKKEMDHIEGIDWPKETRHFLAEKVKKRKALAILDNLTKNSKLTEKDAIELGRKVNRSIWEKHFKKLV